MARVASLFLPQLAIERLRRNERSRALPERAAPLPPVDDDPGACSVPRGCVVRLGTRLGVYIGGSNDWPKLVDALDGMFADRGAKIIARLQARTGRDWIIAQGDPPDAPY